MSNEPTPAAVIQSAEDKAGVIETTLSGLHSQLSEMLPHNEPVPDAAYESGMLGTLDHCMEMGGRLHSRLVDLTEKVGLVRP